MALVDKFINRSDFTSYDDMKKNLKIIIPENFNFGYDIVDEIAKKTPDKVAIYYCDDNGRDFTVSFKEVMDKSNQTANFFKSIGVKKGDFVMLILKRNVEFWYSIVALHKIGAVCIPATHLLTKKDLVYRNNIAGITTIVASNDENILVHTESCESKSPTLKNKIVVGTNRDGWLNFTDEIAKQSTEFARPTGDDATKNEDTMLAYFTSGTTGNPKLVGHNYVYPLGHIITAKFWHNLTPDSIHLTVADTGWAKAAWGKIYGQWICEAAIFVYDMEKFVPNLLLEKLTKHKITSFCAPATIYRFLIKEDLSKYDLSSIKYATIAGEALNPEVYKQFYNLTGLRLHEGFGQSETVCMLGNFPWMETKPGSMGKPSPCYDIELLGDDGRAVEEGEEGEICINIEHFVPGLFDEYMFEEEKTAAAKYNGFYHTGDVAWKDEDGYYWYVGRADDVIKSSGYRIGPFEVESALMEHPSVLETAITAVPDPVRGQIVKATIVLAKGYKPSDELKAELQNHVKSVTAPYKYPRIVEFVKELPKTISGKIKRGDIRKNS